jgi:hypothetical protein
VQAEEREQCEVQRGAAGALLEETTHGERLRLTWSAWSGRPEEVICRAVQAAPTATAAPSRLLLVWPVWTAISKTSHRLAAGAEALKRSIYPPAGRSVHEKHERGGNGPCPGVAISTSPESRAYIRTSYASQPWPWPCARPRTIVLNGDRHKW